MRDIIAANGCESKLNLISQQYRTPNAFYRLPFVDQVIGVGGACTWEAMYVITLGLFEYTLESFHDILDKRRPELPQKSSTHFTRRLVDA